MNENKFTKGVFFDLKKALDVCSHDIQGASGIAARFLKQT
jgi:hypothetical protein